MNFPARFAQSLGSSPWIRAGERIFVACSGGPDSTALYFLLKPVLKDKRTKLGLLHFNHGLRGREASADEAFVRALARKEKIPFYSARGAVSAEARAANLSIEEAARQARYDFFMKSAAKHGIRTIALAHTQDDQAETVLMRLIQGTGPRGLAGIRKELKIGKVLFVRPLLDFSKREIMEFLKENRISFRTDSSNSSERFLRNRVRRQLLPLLARDFNPRIVESLARIPAIQGEEEQLFLDWEEKAWGKCFRLKKGKTIYLRRNVFLKLAPALQFRALERALKSLNPQSGLNFEAWQKIRPGLGKKTFRHSLPKDIDFELTPSQCMIYKKDRF